MKYENFNFDHFFRKCIQRGHFQKMVILKSASQLKKKTGRFKENWRQKSYKGPNDQPIYLKVGGGGEVGWVIQEKDVRKTKLSVKHKLLFFFSTLLEYFKINREF